MINEPFVLYNGMNVAYNFSWPLILVLFIAIVGLLWPIKYHIRKGRKGKKIKGGLFAVI